MKTQNKITLVGLTMLMLTTAFNSLTYAQELVLDKSANGVSYRVYASVLQSCSYINDGRRYELNVYKYTCTVENYTGRKIKLRTVEFNNPGRINLFGPVRQGDGSNCMRLPSTASWVNFHYKILFPNQTASGVMYGYSAAPGRPGFSSSGFDYVR